MATVASGFVGKSGNAVTILGTSAPLFGVVPPNKKESDNDYAKALKGRLATYQERKQKGQ